MLSEMLQSITGLGGYSSIAMIIFFVVFLVMSYRTIRMEKSHIQHLSALPFESSNSMLKQGEK